MGITRLPDIYLRIANASNSKTVDGHNMQTIIHIGAGHCSELEAYLAGNAQRIVLVEPIPALAAKLAQRVKEHSHIIVLEAAVPTAPASNQLNEYNLQGVSRDRKRA